MKRAVFIALFGIFLLPAALAAKVEFKTNLGKMVFEIDEVRAPKTAENFLQYTRDGFFNGLIFHRIIPGFVIQGGGFTPDMKQVVTRPSIVNEADNKLKNLKYTLSMARTSDPNSATSQFFINLRDNTSLDWATNNPGYAVFGKVVEGQTVVDAIAAVATKTVGYFQDVPKNPVVIEQAVVIE